MDIKYTLPFAFWHRLHGDEWALCLASRCVAVWLFSCTGAHTHTDAEVPAHNLLFPLQSWLLKHRFLPFPTPAPNSSPGSGSFLEVCLLLNSFRVYSLYCACNLALNYMPSRQQSLILCVCKSYFLLWLGGSLFIPHILVPASHLIDMLKEKEKDGPYFKSCLCQVVPIAQHELRL